MKEIIVLTETLGVDGPERVISELTEQWVKSNYKVVMVVTRAAIRESTYKIAENIQVIYVDAYASGGKLKRIKEIIRVRKILKEHKNAVCVSLMLSTSFSLAVAAIGLHNKVILSERNDPHQVPFTRFQRKMRDLSLDLADAVVFQTEDAKNYFSARIQKKGTIIYNPVNPNLPEKHNGTRRKVVIAAGRLAPQKNFRLLIDAFAMLVKEFPEYTLLICGEGPEREKLQDRIDELGLNDHIGMPGFSKNVYREMVDCSMYVSSSDYEGMSNSMLEALSMGVPTVCTDCPIGGARTVIKNGVNGLLVGMKDRDALYGAMKRVLSDRVFAQKLSEESYKLREELNIEKISEKWQMLF